MLTGGGDCPGLNAVIRAVVRKGVFHYRDEFVGFLEGWRGLIEDKIPRSPLPKGLLYAAHAGLFHPFLGGNAASRSALSFQSKSQLSPFTDKIGVGPSGYTVANTSDNTPVDANASFSSEAKAREYMARQIGADPSKDGELHVLPNHEVNAA
jgi:hypothetical protein